MSATSTEQWQGWVGSQWLDVTVNLLELRPCDCLKLGVLFSCLCGICMSMDDTLFLWLMCTLQPWTVDLSYRQMVAQYPSPPPHLEPLPRITAALATSWWVHRLAPVWQAVTGPAHNHSAFVSQLLLLPFCIFPVLFCLWCGVSTFSLLEFSTKTQSRTTEGLLPHSTS